VPAFGSDNGKTTISHGKIYYLRVLSEILCQQFCSCSKKFVKLTHFSDGSIKMVLIKNKTEKITIYWFSYVTIITKFAQFGLNQDFGVARSCLLFCLVQMIEILGGKIEKLS
jgi:predicted nucleic acid-binding Zn finger protein